MRSPEYKLIKYGGQALVDSVEYKLLKDGVGG